MAQGNCSIPDCPKRIMARGWCAAHYALWRRNGDPTKNRRTESCCERIQRRSRVDPVTGCWEWQGFLHANGYGCSAYRGSREKLAHRLSYEAFKGPIPDGLHLDHLCKNRCCVNPDHLEPVTPRENVLRSDGIPAVNAQKTHCLRGHPLSGSNVYHPPKQPHKRQCKACSRLRDKGRRSQSRT